MQRCLTIFSLVILVILIGSCGKEQTVTMVIHDIPVNADGPLFEGANTAQGEVLNAIKDFAKSKGINPDKIHSASLKKIQLSVPDSSNFDLFSSINIQFASDQTSMIDAGTINTIKPGSNLIELNLAGKPQNLIDLLKQDKFTLVADVIVRKDSDSNIRIVGELSIEIHY